MDFPRFRRYPSAAATEVGWQMNVGPSKKAGSNVPTISNIKRNERIVGRCRSSNEHVTHDNSWHFW